MRLRTFWGPPNVWHDYSDPPAEVVASTNNQTNAGAIIQFGDLGAHRAGASAANRGFGSTGPLSGRTTVQTMIDGYRVLMLG